MKTINIKKLGMATGLTGALLYLGCMVVMFTVGREGSVKFFNYVCKVDNLVIRPFRYISKI